MFISLGFGIAALIAYAIATTLLWRRLPALRQGETPSKSPALAAAFVGALFHAGVLTSCACDSDGVDLGVLKALSLSGLVTLMIVFVSSLRQPLENLLLPVLPLAMLTLAAQLAWPAAPQNIIGHQPALEIHIMLSILAYSLFTLAALQALLLANQHRALHARRPSAFAHVLPPLEDMETLLFRMISAGFVLLTFALLTGLMYLENIFAQHLVHKTILSIISWAVFGALLIGRYSMGWRGQTAVRWTLSGYAVLLLAFIGSKIALEWVLGVQH
ncbi:MAG: cytochrome c biogenesis protein CcsA [Halothiobacillaceae bacterium]|nr:cytochrome c biogenesis protein CcsA [Halothiobacillaceae bacterium]